MIKTNQPQKPVIVDLNDQIFVNTTLPLEQHAALRSGFMGYPMNPRWDINKYHAWKTGRQLRSDLQQNKLVVRASDCLLIPQGEAEEVTITESAKGRVNLLSTWTKQILTALPIKSPLVDSI